MKKTNNPIQDQPQVYQSLIALWAYSFFFWPLANTIVIILIFAYWLIKTPKFFSYSSARSRLMLLFCLPFLICTVSLFYTENTKTGLAILQLQLPMLIFPLVFGSSYELDIPLLLRSAKKHFTMGTVAACLISLAIAATRYFHSGNPDLLTYQHLNVLSHSFPYTTGISCLLSIAFLLEAGQTPLFNRRITIACTLFLSSFLFLLTIRLNIAILLLLFLYMTIKHISGTIRRALALSGIGIAMVAAVTFIPTLNKKWKETIHPEENKIRLDEDLSLGRSWGGQALRQAIWTCSFDIIRAHPVSGVGTGDVQDELQQAYENRKFYFASRYNRYNAHNQYIQTQLGEGIIGLAALLMCLAIPFFLFAQQPGFSTYGIFLLIMAGISLTESILDVNKGVVWYSFFNAIFAFAHFTKRNIHEGG